MRSGPDFRPPNAEARHLIQYAKELGYAVQMTGSQHLRFQHAASGAIIIASGSPRSGTYKQVYRQLAKRAKPA